jgi:Alkyl sulfatase dimerisation
MNRRAVYMYGAVLDRGPAGQVGAGLGLTNLHNLLTLRGAQVRDPRIWSRCLTEAVNLFADQTDVAFASHHWPTWGRDQIVAFLSLQRDLYGYLHDQTLRLLNAGYTGIEIAELIQLPPALEGAWHTRGYFGSVSHNVKAIYQRYLGWFDGNPASLWELPPGRVGPPLRRLHRRHRRRGGQGQRLPGRRRSPLRRPAAEARRLRRPRDRATPTWPSPSPSRNCPSCSPAAAWKAWRTRATWERSSGC